MTAETSHKKLIMKKILDMSGRYAPYNIFSDWVQMCALAIQNSITMVHSAIWHSREQEYLDTARKYTSEELESFAQMFVWLGDALTEELTDVLGEIYMEAGLGSKYTGQFFTPFHLSELCARTGLNSDVLESDGDIWLNEPSCGGGGMVIAACKVLKDAGVNYQKRLRVVAQDLDWKGVYMTYLQLSLIGCRALVVQGDTLSNPYDPRQTDPAHILRTPAELGLLI